MHRDTAREPDRNRGREYTHARAKNSDLTPQLFLKWATDQVCKKPEE